MAPEPRLVETKAELRRWLSAERKAGRTIGLVPTMGFLHEGHVSLARRARAENDRVVMSIYVNPLQFGPKEDFSAYPRDLDGDLRAAGRGGVDVVFHVTDDEMYPPGFSTHVVPEALVSGLCGARRPGHFRGVTTVVTKLFNLVTPDRAYFGQKDAQQVAVILRMARDLDFGLEVVVCATVREPDGLAMSSRNKYLSPEERGKALVLSRSLAEARRLVAAGERDARAIRSGLVPSFEGDPAVRLDYLELVDPGTLEPAARIDRPVLLAVAAFVGKTRLIDNDLLAP